MSSQDPLPRPYEVVATPDWPPVAIPGHPGWWRHHINGEQVDLPTNETPDNAEENA